MSTYINKDRGRYFNPSHLEAPPFLKEYLNYLDVIQNLAEMSIVSYYLQLRSFLRWISARSRSEFFSFEEYIQEPIVQLTLDDISSCKQQDIYDFLSFSKNVLDNGSSTRKQKLDALRSFFHYFVNIKKTISDNPVLDIPSPKKDNRAERPYLDNEECYMLLHSVTGRYQERDFCILTFFLNCGMRLSELVNINLKDIRGNRILLHGKGRKERILYLNQSCMEALSHWLYIRNTIEKMSKNEMAVFVSPMTGRRLCRRQVEDIVNKAIKNAGLDGKGYSTHTLRHTAATHLFKAGVDVLTLQSILGHESVETTRIYTHVGEEEIEKAMLKNDFSIT